MRRRSYQALALASLGSALPSVAIARESALATALSGGTLVAGSLAVLGLAVLFKAAAFAVFETRLPKWKSVVTMLAASVVSTVVGLPLVWSAALPMASLCLFPVVFLTLVFAARRLVVLKPWPILASVSPGLLALGLTGLYVLSFVLAGRSLRVMAVMGSTRGCLFLYWSLKFLYVYAALLVSLLLTSCCEEWTIGKLAGDRFARASFLIPVLKANIVTVGLLVVHAAVRILPERLASPGTMATRLRLLGETLASRWS